MESMEHRYTLCPMRFIFGVILNMVILIGTITTLIYFHPASPIFWILAITGCLALLFLGVIQFISRIVHAQALLIIAPDGLKVNFSGLGRLVDIPWEQILYAKYYAFSIDQYALGIALKDSTCWTNALSLPEKALVKAASITGKTTINIQQNIVKEPLVNAVTQIQHYVAFDQNLIKQLEHPQKKRQNLIA